MGAKPASPHIKEMYCKICTIEQSFHYHTIQEYLRQRHTISLVIVPFYYNKEKEDWEYTGHIFHPTKDSHQLIKESYSVVDDYYKCLDFLLEQAYTFIKM